MRAALYHGREDLRLEQVDEPEPGPGEVKLRIELAGICGTDLHEYYLGPLLTRAETPHPTTGVKNPVILGHELCGSVVAVGEEVDDLEEGQLVAVSPTEYCGSCESCRRGESVSCTQKAVHGMTRRGGAFCEFTIVRRAMAHPLPGGMSVEQGALIEPLAVGLQAAGRTAVAAGETAAVHGAGPIGLGAALSLKAAGVRTIILDPSPLRRGVARRLGFDEVLDPTESDPVLALRELTDGVGVAGSIDAAGVQVALDAAIASTAVDRTVTIVAVPMGPLSIQPQPFRANLIRLTASTGRQDFPGTIAAMDRGDYPLDGWVSTIPLERIVEDGFEPLHRKERMKVLVDPWHSV